jgi:hypothetical protein
VIDMLERTTSSVENLLADLDEGVLAARQMEISPLLTQAWPVYVPFTVSDLRGSRAVRSGGAVADGS